jgi:hypothetical protein
MFWVVITVIAVIVAAVALIWGFSTTDQDGKALGGGVRTTSA